MEREQIQDRPEQPIQESPEEAAAQTRKVLHEAAAAIRKARPGPDVEPVFLFRA